jgi:hypothetical protein
MIHFPEERICYKMREFLDNIGSNKPLRPCTIHFCITHSFERDGKMIMNGGWEKAFMVCMNLQTGHLHRV